MIIKSIKPEIVLGCLLGALAGWIVFMAFDNEPPYVYDSIGSYVEPEHPSGGDWITVKWRLKHVNRVCPGVVQRVLFDPVTKIIIAKYDQTQAANVENINDGYLIRTFALPRLLPTGKIAYRADVCYYCNALQHLVRPLCVPTPNLIFDVRETEIPKQTRK